MFLVKPEPSSQITESFFSSITHITTPPPDYTTMQTYIPIITI